MTPEMLRADAADRVRLGEMLKAEIPALWPPEHWEPHVFDFIEKQYREFPHTRGWNRYVVLCTEHPVLVGTLGAFARSETEAEIGYSILEPWQRQGFATEGTRALVAQLFAYNGVLQSIVAHTFPALTASLKVMERCGLTFDGPGDEAGTVRYCVQRAAFERFATRLSTP